MESYMYYRAFVIIARKVEKELVRIGREQSDGMFSPESVNYTKEIYDGFTIHSANKMRDIAEMHPVVIKELSEKLARSGVLKVEEHILNELIEYRMITQRVHKLLHEELEKEAEHQGQYRAGV